MKLLAFLFALYMIALPCLPCGDKDGAVPSTVAMISSSAGSANEPHTDEVCNPFCSCACCGHVFAQHFQISKVSSLFPAMGSQQQYFYKNIFLPSDFFGNIWQPPKV